jgi:hypothetical protein
MTVLPLGCGELEGDCLGEELESVSLSAKDPLLDLPRREDCAMRAAGLLGTEIGAAGDEEAWSIQVTVAGEAVAEGGEVRARGSAESGGAARSTRCLNEREERLQVDIYREGEV